MCRTLFLRNDTPINQNSGNINIVHVCADLFGMKILPCLILEDDDTNWDVSKDGLKPFDVEKHGRAACISIRNTKKYFINITVDKFRLEDGAEVIPDQKMFNGESFGFSFPPGYAEIYLIADEMYILIAYNGRTWEVKKMSWLTEDEKIKIEKSHAAHKAPAPVKKPVYDQKKN